MKHIFLIVAFLLPACSTINSAIKSVQSAGGSFQSGRGKHRTGIHSSKQIDEHTWFISVRSSHSSNSVSSIEYEWNRVAISKCPNGFIGTPSISSRSNYHTSGYVSKYGNVSANTTTYTFYTASGVVICD